MAKEKTTKKTKKKKKKTLADYILIFGIIIILIPCIGLGYFLYQAQKENDTPILGKRTDNERTAEITQAQLDTLSTAMNALSSVEKAEVHLQVSTLRIYLDISDNENIEDIEETIKAAYAAVDSQLPIDQYFTNRNGAREYDLEIHAYNNRDYIGTDRWIYVTLVRTSAMDSYVIDTPSIAREEDLARELRGENVSASTVEGEGDAEETVDETGEETGGE